MNYYIDRYRKKFSQEGLDKPLTVGMLYEFTQEALLPAMAQVIKKTVKDSFAQLPSRETSDMEK